MVTIPVWLLVVLCVGDVLGAALVVVAWRNALRRANRTLDRILDRILAEQTSLPPIGDQAHKTQP
jgi:hypothetical protein